MEVFPCRRIFSGKANSSPIASSVERTNASLPRSSSGIFSRSAKADSIIQRLSGYREEISASNSPYVFDFHSHRSVLGTWILYPRIRISPRKIGYMQFNQGGSLIGVNALGLFELCEMYASSTSLICVRREIALLDPAEAVSALPFPPKVCFAEFCATWSWASTPWERTYAMIRSRRWRSLQRSGADSSA